MKYFPLTALSLPSSSSFLSLLSYSFPLLSHSSFNFLLPPLSPLPSPPSSPFSLPSFGLYCQVDYYRMCVVPLLKRFLPDSELEAKVGGHGYKNLIHTGVLQYTNQCV